MVDLRCEIQTGGARSVVIDTAVSELVAQGDERLPENLLSLLSDKAEHDEGMFSLIHAAEEVDDRRYVEALLAVFPGLSSSAPRWASIVLMRVLNNAGTQTELVRRLDRAPADVKASVRGMCERINAVSPQFLAKTVPVTVAAS